MQPLKIGNAPIVILVFKILVLLHALFCLICFWLLLPTVSKAAVYELFRAESQTALFIHSSTENIGFKHESKLSQSLVHVMTDGGSAL